MVKRIISAIVIAAFIFTQCGLGAGTAWALRPAQGEGAKAVGDALGAGAAGKGKEYTLDISRAMDRIERLVTGQTHNSIVIIISPDGTDISADVRTFTFYGSGKKQRQSEWIDFAGSIRKAIIEILGGIEKIRYEKSAVVLRYQNNGNTILVAPEEIFMPAVAASAPAAGGAAAGREVPSGRPSDAAARGATGESTNNPAEFQKMIRRAISENRRLTITYKNGEQDGPLRVVEIVRQGIKVDRGGYPSKEEILQLDYGNIESMSLEGASKSQPISEKPTKLQIGTEEMFTNDSRQFREMIETLRAQGIAISIIFRGAGGRGDTAIRLRKADIVGFDDFDDLAVRAVYTNEQGRYVRHWIRFATIKIVGSKAAADKQWPELSAAGGAAAGREVPSGRPSDAAARGATGASGETVGIYMRDAVATTIADLAKSSDRIYVAFFYGTNSPQGLPLTGTALQSKGKINQTINRAAGAVASSHFVIVIDKQNGTKAAHVFAAEVEESMTADYVIDWLTKKIQSGKLAEASVGATDNDSLDLIERSTLVLDAKDLRDLYGEAFDIAFVPSRKRAYVVRGKFKYEDTYKNYFDLPGFKILSFTLPDKSICHIWHPGSSGNFILDVEQIAGFKIIGYDGSAQQVSVPQEIIEALRFIKEQMADQELELNPGENAIIFSSPKGKKEAFLRVLKTEIKVNIYYPDTEEPISRSFSTAGAAGEGLVVLLQKYMPDYLKPSDFPTGEKITIYADGGIQFGSRDVAIKVDAEDEPLLQPILGAMKAANLGRLSISPAVLHEPLCHAFLDSAFANLSKVTPSTFAFFLCGNVVLRMDSVRAPNVEGVFVLPTPAAYASLFSAINERRPASMQYEAKGLEGVPEPSVEYQQTQVAFRAALELYRVAFAPADYSNAKTDVEKIIQDAGLQPAVPSPAGAEDGYKSIAEIETAVFMNLRVILRRLMDAATVEEAQGVLGSNLTGLDDIFIPANGIPGFEDIKDRTHAARDALAEKVVSAETPAAIEEAFEVYLNEVVVAVREIENSEVYLNYAITVALTQAGGEPAVAEARGRGDRGPVSFGRPPGISAPGVARGVEPKSELIVSESERQKASGLTGLLVADSEDEAITERERLLAFNIGLVRGNIQLAWTQEQIDAFKGQNFDFIRNVATLNKFKGLPAAGWDASDVKGGDDELKRAFIESL